MHSVRFSRRPHFHKLFEQVLKSPLVLEPAGNLMNVGLKMKTATDKAWATWWGAMGLATKRDQERALHTFFQRLNFIFSFRGLRQYKAKFATAWEPRYLIYSQATELPRVALALRRVSEMPTGEQEEEADDAAA